MYQYIIMITLSLCGSSESSTKTQSLPGVHDLVSGFRQNYYSFLTLRLLWTRKQQYAKMWFTRQEESAKKFERQSNDKSKSAQERAKSLERYQNVKKMLEHPNFRQPTISFQEFLTDRKNFQVRVFSASSESELPSGYSFSKKLPADAVNLKTVFAHVPLSSYDQSRAEFKVWSGLRNGRDYYRAEISVTKVVNNKVYFPPLGVDSQVWGDNWNQIDEFFARPESQMRVDRNESLDGVHTYVLEHIVEREFPSDVFPRELRVRFPGKLQLFDITTAWIDDKRGCIPLRIEKSGAFYYEGRRLGPPIRPAELLTVTELRTVEGGGWYPTKGRVEAFAIDTAWSKGPNNLEMLLTGRFNVLPYNVYNTVSWEILHVETVADKADLFKFEFPEGTEYYDEKTKAFVFKGDRQTYFEKVL
jgi:hypothetical protein